MYKFTIKITQNDLFKSSLNYIKNSKTFFFDLIFTFVAICATIYSFYNNTYINQSIYKMYLLIFCCILFPIVQPLFIYIKSVIHAKKIKDMKVTIEFLEDKILLFSQNENTEVLYENVYNFIKFKNMIVIMYDSIHGQIIPDRYLNDKKDEFYNYVSEKIKYARNKRKESIN